MIRPVVALLALLALAAPARAQVLDDAKGAPPLAVSVDCPGRVPGCDVDFQVEVPFAQFVRDPSGADVAVLITQQATGGGGRRYDLFFRGRRGRVAGRVDTLTVQTGPSATDDDRRRALLGRLALGVTGYAARTGLADRISVSFAAPQISDAPAEEVRDPWNNWVFEVQGDGSVDGQQRTSSLRTSGSFSASRVTDRWKTKLRPNGSYRRNSYELQNGSTVVSERTSIGMYGQVVRALSPHWSAAVDANASRSTYQNYDARLTGGPAIEYNVFPYTESTRRQLRISAGLSGEAVAYADTTLFDETSELNVRQNYGATAVFAQPWGSTNVDLDASHILTRPDKYRLGLSGRLNVRILRGLNARVSGNVSLIRDQINLPGGGASDEDVLTQQRELATGYDYSLSLGLSYTFGSIYNSVVNSRFGT